MKRLMIKISMLLISVLIYCSGCRKDNITYNFDYKIVQQADLTNLLMFYDGPNIIGLDTTDFTIKAQIRVDDMSFGGVAKLPSGGVAFTYSRRASNDGWGSLLYVTKFKRQQVMDSGKCFRN